MIRLAGIAVAAAIVLLGGFMVWNGPRCSGPLPSDRCPIVATVTAAEPVAPKGDRLALQQPPQEAAAVIVPVKAMPSPPAPLPALAPVAQIAAPEPPAAARRAPVDICARHGLRKVWVSARSWRCQK